MSPSDQGEEVTPELLYGLGLNLDRCKSIIGVQLFKSIFYSNIYGFKMDRHMVDAIGSHETDGPIIANRMLQEYLIASRQR